MNTAARRRIYITAPGLTSRTATVPPGSGFMRIGHALARAVCWLVAWLVFGALLAVVLHNAGNPAFGLVLAGVCIGMAFDEARYIETALRAWRGEHRDPTLIDEPADPAA